jgi:integrase
MALTDATVKTAKPADKPYKLGDAGGLYLFVTPAGGKLWRLKYRIDGKEQKLSLGAYPDVSLADARAKRDEARKQLANSINPASAKKEALAQSEINKQNTFEFWSKRWLAHWQNDKSPFHVASTQRRLENDIYPAIGNKPMTSIDAMHIADIMRAISARGALDLAKRSKTTISQVFRSAMANDTRTVNRVSRNPAIDFMPSDIIQPRKAKNHARVDIKELPALLRAIDTSETRAITRIAIKLMAYTFVRTSELIQAKWCEFDLDANEWRIPADRMKMNSPHIVPLASQAIELLETLKNITGGGDYLFPHFNNHNKTMSNNTILKALERMGYKGTMTGHGFRGIASTALHEQGFDHQHIELQLAHSERNEVSAAYNHALYLTQRKAMMQQWANYLDELKAGAKVISLHGKSA